MPLTGVNFTWISQLKSINYKSNQIGSIETTLESTFKTVNFDIVIKMDFSHNLIENVDLTKLFTEKSKMERISLADNLFRAIPSHLFTLFRLLKTLTLESNRITTIDAYSFYLQFLENLNLARNMLGPQLIPNTFDGLFQLKYLNLSANRLEFIDSNAFKDLYKLLSLDLAYNRVKLIGDFAFASAVSLKALSLLGNKLVRFENQTFVGLVSVKTIHVDYYSLDAGNIENMVSSLRPSVYKHLLSRVYFRSINILYPR